MHSVSARRAMAAESTVKQSRGRRRSGRSASIHLSAYPESGVSEYKKFGGFDEGLAKWKSHSSIRYQSFRSHLPNFHIHTGLVFTLVTRCSSL